ELEFAATCGSGLVAGVRFRRFELGRLELRRGRFLAVVGRDGTRRGTGRTPDAFVNVVFNTVHALLEFLDSLAETSCDFGELLTEQKQANCQNDHHFPGTDTKHTIPRSKVARVEKALYPEQEACLPARIMIRCICVTAVTAYLGRSSGPASSIPCV